MSKQIIFSTKSLERAINEIYNIFNKKSKTNDDIVKIFTSKEDSGEKIVVHTATDDISVFVKSPIFFNKETENNISSELEKFNKELSPYLNSYLSQDSEYEISTNEIFLSINVIKNLLKNTNKNSLATIVRKTEIFYELDIENEGQYLLKVNENKDILWEEMEEVQEESNGFNSILKSIVKFAKQTENPIAFFNTDFNNGCIIGIGENTTIWSNCEEIAIEDGIKKAFLPIGFVKAINSKNILDNNKSYFEIRAGYAKFYTEEENTSMDITAKTQIEPTDIDINIIDTAIDIENNFSLSFSFKTDKIKKQIKRAVFLSKLNQKHGIANIKERDGKIELQIESASHHKGIEILNTESVTTNTNGFYSTSFFIKDFELITQELIEGEIFMGDEYQQIYIKGINKDNLILNFLISN